MEGVRRGAHHILCTIVRPGIAALQSGATLHSTSKLLGWIRACLTACRLRLQLPLPHTMCEMSTSRGPLRRDWGASVRRSNVGRYTPLPTALDNIR
jgi:hypothetical protein